jgi:arsenate reductase
MAEALLRHIDPRNFEAYSAGASCQQVHPLAIEAMKEIGLDLGKKPKPLDALHDEAFDFVVTFDDDAAVRSRSITALERVHWNFEDPRRVSNDPEIARRAFRSVRDQITQRLRLFVIVNVRPVVSERTRLVESPANPLIQLH